MTEATTEETAFGCVLGDLIQARNIPATRDNMAELAESSGIEPEEFLARVDSEQGANLDSLDGIEVVLSLSDEEEKRLAMAFSYE